MDSAQGQNGLLAIVAQATNQGKKLDETRCACAVSSCVMAGSSFTILSETPCADPPVRRIGAGCCEGWGLDTPGYPISRAQVYALSSQVNVMLFTEQS